MNPSSQPTPQMLDLSRSPEIFDKAELIGNKFSLHIDQVGELDAEIRDIISGSTDSRDFIKDIMRRLEIDRDVANEIVAEVNREIFQVIKDKLQADTRASDISSVEQAGNFTVDQATLPDHSLANEVHSQAPVEDHATILDHIENPSSGNAKIMRKESRINAEPLMDHLLNNATSQPEQKVVYQAPKPMNYDSFSQSSATTQQTPRPSTPATPVSPTPPTTPAQPAPVPVTPPLKKIPGSDPYLEPIK